MKTTAPKRETHYQGERWFQLLIQAIDETSATSVAARMGYSRAAISQIKHGIYIGKPDKIAARVMELFDRWPCPYLNTSIIGEDCRAVYTSETPSHDPARLAHRRVCRTCNHKGDRT